MGSLEPVIAGQTVEDLWPVAHLVALMGWALILIAPFWKPALNLAYLPPVFQAVLYAAILVPKILFPGPDSPPVDFNDMYSIQAIFEDPNVFFCGWIHYLAFDQLVGIGMAHDALHVLKVSKLLFYSIVLPCLFLAFYLGPVGYLSYFIARRFLISDEPSSIKKE